MRRLFRYIFDLINLALALVALTFIAALVSQKANTSQWITAKGKQIEEMIKATQEEK